jgi:MOSC domain-containing protein YiiM
MTTSPTSTVAALFAGGLRHLAPEGQRSGIFKQRLGVPARVGVNGIEGDEHADTRVHGGPQKALHQYPLEGYTRLAQRHPGIASDFVPGSLGENLSTAAGMTEESVHVGDVWRIGGVVAQVSQPRSPCWKIDHRFGIERLSVFVAQERITGWYYRVIEGGLIAEGDAVALLERHTDRFSIAEFWRVQQLHRPEADDLSALAAVPGLAPDWQRRFAQRAQWLREQPPA